MSLPNIFQTPEFYIGFGALVSASGIIAYAIREDYVGGKRFAREDKVNLQGIREAESDLERFMEELSSSN